jgi:GLPGLI family protein
MHTKFKYTILTLLLFIQVSFISSQEKGILLEYTVNVHFNEIDGMISFGGEVQNVIDEESTKTYELLYKNKKSIFYQKDVKTLKDIKASGINLKNYGYDTYRNDTLYIDYVKNTFTHKKHFKLDDILLIKDKLPEVKWNLTDETKRIGEFNCKKATAKLESGENFEYDEKIVAWYSTDIVRQSISLEKFNGLPGVIVKLKYKHTEYLLNELKIVTSNSIDFAEPSIGKPTNKNGFRGVYLSRKNN